MVHVLYIITITNKNMYDGAQYLLIQSQGVPVLVNPLEPVGPLRINQKQ